MLKLRGFSYKKIMMMKRKKNASQKKQKKCKGVETKFLLTKKNT